MPNAGKPKVQVIAGCVCVVRAFGAGLTINLPSYVNHHSGALVKFLKQKQAGCSWADIPAAA